METQQEPLEHFMMHLMLIGQYTSATRYHLQIAREPRPLPIMKINPDVKDIFAFRYDDFELEGYNPWPHIKAEVSV